MFLKVIVLVVSTLGLGGNHSETYKLIFKTL